MEFFEYIDYLDKPFDIFYTDSVASPRHWHYYSEILYIRQGSIKVICNDGEVILDEGDVCYFYPLQLHEVTKAQEGKVDYAVVKFDIHTIHIPEAYLQKIYDYFVRRSSEKDFCLLLSTKKQTEELGQLIVNTVEEYQKKQEFFTLQIQANLFSILISMARQMEQPENNREEKHSDSSLSFQHILEYIDIHSAEPLEIQDLARQCNMSYSHFAKLFRENYGRSCKEYINYIRLNKAEELLVHTDYDMSYIACETGFFDSSHFIRSYKKWKGITPKQQRMRL